MRSVPLSAGEERKRVQSIRFSEVVSSEIGALLESSQLGVGWGWAMLLCREVIVLASKAGLSPRVEDNCKCLSKESL